MEITVLAILVFCALRQKQLKIKSLKIIQVKEKQKYFDNIAFPFIVIDCELLHWAFFSVYASLKCP